MKDILWFIIWATVITNALSYLFGGDLISISSDSASDKATTTIIKTTKSIY